ncbi:sulfatase [Roseibium sp. TrichSKD4]|nr:sulfatase [Roseibium sp. TrichSKD4]
MIRRPQQTATRNKYHDHVFPDVEALVSVSPVNKHRMNKQRERESNLAYHIRDLVQHYKLDWMGLSEEQLIEQIENIAWDRP